MTTPTMILIVDDHVDSADVLGLVMKMNFPDTAVLVNYAGPQAIDSATRQRPDVALLDMEMPEMDGEALAQRLRSLYPGAAPLLIALSGNLERLEQAMGNGSFDRCMSKPVDLDALTRMVQQRLGG
ncbi:MAG: response regulator [Comamonas sp.]|uniref:response regulator n=1 Tax=Comamonas sp. TaxID=34028 RepID=UPI002FC6672E